MLTGQSYKLMIITAINKNIQRITFLDESEVAPSRLSTLNWKGGELSDPDWNPAPHAP